MELCTRFLVHNKFSGDSPRELDEFCYYFIVLEFNLHPKKKKKTLSKHQLSNPTVHCHTWSNFNIYIYIYVHVSSKHQ